MISSISQQPRVLRKPGVVCVQVGLEEQSGVSEGLKAEKSLSGRVVIPRGDSDHRRDLPWLQ